MSTLSTTAAPSSTQLVAEPAEPVTDAATTAASTAAEAGLTAAAKMPWFVSAGIGLWRLRLFLTAGSASAGLHTAAIIALAFVTTTSWDRQTTPPVAAVEAVILKPIAESRELPPPLPIKFELQQSVKSVVPQSQAAHGSGSVGENGGRGGGKLGGTLVAGLSLGPIKSAAGGTGSGLEDAFGTHMLGEVGEASDGKASFFGVEAKGRRFIFVVDTSGSMRHNDRYLRCREELLRSVSAMKYGQQYFIIFFNDDLFFMPENKLVDARPEQLARTTQWLIGAVPSGGTEPWPGLQRALRMAPDAIFLLTDGQFDPQVVAKVDRIQPETKKKIPIHTIAFESPQGALLLEAIAKQSGGTHRFVP